MLLSGFLFVRSNWQKTAAGDVGAPGARFVREVDDFLPSAVEALGYVIQKSA